MGSFCAANIPFVSAWTEFLLKNTSIAEPGGLHLTAAGLHSYQDSLPSDVTPYFLRAGSLRGVCPAGGSPRAGLVVALQQGS